jgi:hypothetical protein
VERKRYKSTLVGHPAEAGSATPPPLAPGGPILSPPRWRGAQAYQGSDEPQPRISSVPAPAPAETAPPVPTAIGPDGKPITSVSSSPPAADPERIGEAIEELLDGQASVAMQDEDRPSIPELAIEDVLDSFSEPELEPVPLVSPPPAPQNVARIKLRSAPAPIDFAEDPVLAPVREEPVVLGSEAEVMEDDDASASPPPLPGTPALPEASEAAEDQPSIEVSAPIEASEAPALREGSEARSERAELPAMTPPAPGVVSSLAPAVIEAREQRERERSSGLGILLVAAMAVIGVGGWLLTRGTFDAPRAEAPAPQPAAAAAVPPAPEPEPAPVPEAEPEPEAPAEQAAPVVKAKPQKPRKKAAARRKVARAQEPKAEPTPAPPEPAAAPVIKPRNTELPDTPSREAVVSALAPVRAAVRACAPGQRGVAQVDLTVSGNGKVTHAVVGGDFSGTPEGSCIARAVRSARFEPFKQPRFRVIYPFSL